MAISRSPFRYSTVADRRFGTAARDAGHNEALVRGEVNQFGQPLGSSDPMRPGANDDFFEQVKLRKAAEQARLTPTAATPAAAPSPFRPVQQVATPGGDTEFEPAPTPEPSPGMAANAPTPFRPQPTVLAGTARPDAAQMELIRASNAAHLAARSTAPIPMSEGDPVARAWNAAHGTGNPNASGAPSSGNIFQQQPGLVNRPDVAAYIQRHGMAAAVAKAGDLLSASPVGFPRPPASPVDPAILAAAGTNTPLQTQYGTISSISPKSGPLQGPPAMQGPSAPAGPPAVPPAQPAPIIPTNPTNLVGTPYTGTAGTNVGYPKAAGAVVPPGYQPADTSTVTNTNPPAAPWTGGLNQPSVPPSPLPATGPFATVAPPPRLNAGDPRLPLSPFRPKPVPALAPMKPGTFEAPPAVPTPKTYKWTPDDAAANPDAGTASAFRPKKPAMPLMDRPANQY